MLLRLDIPSIRLAFFIFERFGRKKVFESGKQIFGILQAGAVVDRLIMNCWFGWQSWRIVIGWFY
jgi:hypothetical protein